MHQNQSFTKIEECHTLVRGHIVSCQDTPLPSNGSTDFTISNTFNQCLKIISEVVVSILILLVETVGRRSVAPFRSLCH